MLSYGRLLLYVIKKRYFLGNKNNIILMSLNITGVMLNYTLMTSGDCDTN